LAVVAAVVALTLPAAAQTKGNNPFADGPYQPEENSVSTCPEFGPGYYRVGTTGTCFRIGGSVMAETAIRSGSAKGGRDVRSSTANVGGKVRFEAVTQTEMGPMRLMIQGGGETGR
jgi:hypothetical protein